MVVIARLDRNIGIVRGNQFSIRRTITRVPNGFTVSKAWLTVLNTPDGVFDPVPAFSKEITTANSPGVGQVEDNAAVSRIIRIRFDLDTNDTDELEDGNTYDIQLLSTNGDIVTVERGPVGSIIERITQDSS